VNVDARQNDQPEVNVQMGENETAMEYDQDLIFKHLCVSHVLLSPHIQTPSRCFYLDSPDKARENGMLVKSKREEDINRRQLFPVLFNGDCSPKLSFDSFAELAKTITENGGRIVDLDEPKLTHVVVDKRDDSRRQELIKRTSKSVILCYHFEGRVLTA
jgi:DNA ligase-4